MQGQLEKVVKSKRLTPAPEMNADDPTINTGKLAKREFGLQGSLEALEAAVNPDEPLKLTSKTGRGVRELNITGSAAPTAGLTKESKMEEFSHFTRCTQLRRFICPASSTRRNVLPSRTSQRCLDMNILTAFEVAQLRQPLPHQMHLRHRHDKLAATRQEVALALHELRHEVPWQH